MKKLTTFLFALTLSLTAFGQFSLPSTTHSRKILRSGSAEETRGIIGSLSVTNSTAEGSFSFGLESEPGAPTVALNAVAGNLNGAYYYRVTFVTANGETAMGARSAAVSPVNQQVNISAIPLGTSRVTARKIYRTTGGGGGTHQQIILLVATIANNTTTTYADNIADGSLGAQAPGNNTTGANMSSGGVKFGEASQYTTIFGRGAGAVNASPYNVFIGALAGEDNTTGFANTFVGFGSGNLVTEGEGNAFFGYQSGLGVTTGDFNTLVGVDAGFVLGAGSRNTLVGHHVALSAVGVNDTTILGYQSGLNLSSGNSSTFVGAVAGWANTTATGNTAVGANALFANVTAIGNVAMGYNAGRNLTTTGNTIVGYNSGYYSSTGLENSMFGYLSGFSNSLGSRNIYFGKSAGFGNEIGSDGVFIGHRAGYTSTNSGNVFIGTSAGFSTLDGARNVFIGQSSGFSSVSGSNSVHIGYGSGNADTNSNRLIIDNQTRGVGFEPIQSILYGVMDATASNQSLVINATTTNNGAFKMAGPGVTLISGGSHQDSTFYGYQAGAVNNTPASADGIYNTFIGASAGVANTSGYNQTFVGRSAGAANTTGILNTAIGYQALAGNLTGNNNVTLGVNAGAGLTVSHDNVVIGTGAGLSLNPASGSSQVTIIGKDSGGGGANTGTLNAFLGYRTGFSNTTGFANTFVGNLAGFGNQAGNYNTFLGESAGKLCYGVQNTYVGARSGFAATSNSSNTGLGHSSLFSLTSGGQNTSIGQESGRTMTTGTGNVFLGWQAGYYETGSSTLMIDNIKRASEADGRTKALIYGTFASTVAAQQVTINGALTVAGTLTAVIAKQMVIIADATVANTVTETTLLGAVTGTKTIAANALTVGRSFSGNARGRYSTAVVAGTARIKVKLGAVTILDTGAQTMPNSSVNKMLDIDFDIVCRTTGASGTVYAQGRVVIGDVTGLVPQVLPMVNTTTSTIDTTVPPDLDVTITWGTADAGNTATISLGSFQ